MRWPYQERVDAVHAWGTVGAGIAVAGSFYAARALNPQTARSWAWPTNWMIIPVIIFTSGLILLVLPLRRSRRPEPSPSQVPASKTLSGVIVDGNARLVLDSSAEQLVHRTRFTDNAQVWGRHVPGRPDILADSMEPPHGQESQAQAEALEPERPDGKRSP